MSAVDFNVYRESNDFSKDPAEECVRCHKPTRFWLTTHIPLCPICAKYANMFIKNCPYCNSKMLVLDMISKREYNTKRISYRVQCCDCLASGPIKGSEFGTLNSKEMQMCAIDLWNERALSETLYVF